MPRPSIHSADAMLDAAAGLVLAGGPRAASVGAIARASGAPTGSLYHRFGSRDRLLVELWIRAVRRFQERYLAAAEGEDPVEVGAAMAGAVVDFARRQPADARLLLTMRREDLLDGEVTGELATRLESLDWPVEEALGALARRVHGRATRGAIELVRIAVIDLPYGAVRRHLVGGGGIPNRLREDVQQAVRDVLLGQIAT